MKIWISKNSEVPVREQLIAQMTLGIAAGDFKIGEKLPSTREIARRCDLHSNTVGSAYQKLVEQKLVEFRRGSGFYVAEAAGERIAGTRQLELLTDNFLRSANALGFDDDDVIAFLKKPRRSRSKDGLLVVESDKGLRTILIHELSQHFAVSGGVSPEELTSGEVPKSSLLVAMLDEKPKIEPYLGGGQQCVYLKGRSVSAAMSGQSRPAADETVAVVSGWGGFLSFARIMLLAANLDPGNLVVRSTSDDGWRDSVKRAAVIICDTHTASGLDPQRNIRQFQIISDDSLVEIADLLN